MRPDFSIEVGGTDYTAQIRERLSELVITDKAGFESDSVSIVLDDRQPHIAQPARGALVGVSIGYAGALVFKGRYVHDGTQFTGWPQKMTISALAVNVRGAFNTHRLRTFYDLSLGDLVRRIAGEQGYQTAVDSYYDGVSLAWVEQADETDAVFLHRLAKDYGATFKATGQTVVFCRRGPEKDESLRSAFGSFEIRPGEHVRDFSVLAEDESPFSQVVAQYHDNNSGLTESVFVGTGDKVKRLRRVFGSESEAQAAADAEFKNGQRAAVTGSMTLIGRPDLAAEGELVLSGFRDGVNGVYTLTSVVHRLGADYTTEIEFEMAV